jgi:GR25 family glycosyltransferase involved in LPS biosynthesis
MLKAYILSTTSAIRNPILESQLQRCGISATIVVNPRNETNFEYSERKLSLKTNSITQSEFGCLRGHIRMWHLANTEKVDGAFFFEDDATVDKTKLIKFIKVIENLKGSHIYLLGSCGGLFMKQWSGKTTLSNFSDNKSSLFNLHRRVGSQMIGSHAYFINFETRSDLLKANEEPIAPIDLFLTKKRRKVFVLDPQIAGQLSGVGSQVWNDNIERERPKPLHHLLISMRSDFREFRMFRMFGVKTLQLLLPVPALKRLFHSPPGCRQQIKTI